MVVAGGGRGIGRACSLLLGQHGARVLVVDPGVAQDGTGRDAGVADGVAREIAAAGGTAIGLADAIGSFEDGERIVARCIAEYGGLDAVLAPAAILRDRMIFNVAESDWRTVLDVNLSAVFGLVRAACIVMRPQQRGRIVTFTSAAGLEGRAGTSAYASAKAGVVGLTKSVARDMERYGVAVNCICPRAETRLTQHVSATQPVDIAAPLEADGLGPPDDVAQLAVYLASARCSATGRVFFCGEGRIGLYADFVPERVVSAGGEDIARVAEGLLEEI